PRARCTRSCSRGLGALLPGGLARAVGSGRMARRPALLALRGRGFGGLRGAALGAEARLERLHQIDDLRAGADLGRRRGDLLAIDLLLDESTYALSDVVLVGFGLEGIGGDLLDELHRELQLGVLRLRVADRDSRARASPGRVAELLTA